MARSAYAYSAPLRFYPEALLSRGASQSSTEDARGGPDPTPIPKPGERLISVFPCTLRVHDVVMCAIRAWYKAQLSTDGPSTDSLSCPPQHFLSWPSVLFSSSPVPWGWPRRLLQSDGAQRYVRLSSDHRGTRHSRENVRWIGSNQHGPHLGQLHRLRRGESRPQPHLRLLRSSDGLFQFHCGQGSFGRRKISGHRAKQKGHPLCQSWYDSDM